MSKLRKIIAFSLMALVVTVILAMVYEVEAGFEISGLKYFIEELFTPRIAYSKFQELIANKETAKKI